MNCGRAWPAGDLSGLAGPACWQFESFDPEMSNIVEWRLEDGGEGEAEQTGAVEQSGAARPAATTRHPTPHTPAGTRRNTHIYHAGPAR